MTLSALRDGFQRSAFAVTLALCLLVQTLIAGVFLGQQAAASLDVLADYGIVLCTSHDGSSPTDSSTGHPASHENACLSHCVAAAGTGTTQPFNNVAQPKAIAIAVAERVPLADQITEIRIASGAGARAPPSLTA